MPYSEAQRHTEKSIGRSSSGVCADLVFWGIGKAVEYCNRELCQMPNRFLCPKCHGQRTTSCAVCGGIGKRTLAGIPSGVCKECKGSGHQRCDVCGGTGEIEAADRT